MKLLIMLSLLLGFGACLAGCGGSPETVVTSRPDLQGNETEPAALKKVSTGKYSDGSSPVFGDKKLRLSLGDGQELVIAMYDNTAVDALIERLPLNGLEFYDLNGIEKPIQRIEPPLSPGEEPLGYDPIPGEMVFYLPWGIFTIFYGDLEYNDDLIPLGLVESGLEALSSQTEDFTGSLELMDESSPAGETPLVYMTSDISPEALMAVYEALAWTPSGNLAVKLSTGEPGSNYLRTELIGELIAALDEPTIVECNTAYGGPRSGTAMHYQLAEDHGYTAIAKVDIMDENGSITLPVSDGRNISENYVGANFENYGSFLVLSHFKGHAMAGFGGAIKNISIGIASAQGKAHIHTGGKGGSMWGGEQNAFLESMAEAGKSVVEALDGQIVYINVMNRLSVDCDCDSNPAEPDMHDVGILASYDPVALDQACIDLVYAQSEGEGASLVQRIESRNGLLTLEHAQEIGLGSRSYTLVSLDG